MSASRLQRLAAPWLLGCRAPGTDRAGHMRTAATAGVEIIGCDAWTSDYSAGLTADHADRTAYLDSYAQSCLIRTFNP